MANNTDALLTPSMPHSPQAEQAVLGSMLIDADCVKDVMDKLQAQDFYLRTNREIFETIYSMFVYSKPIDGVTVAGEMEKNGTYEESTTRPYLAQLMDVTPTSANVMEYVGIVRDKALLRALYTVAGEISTMVQDGTGGASSVLDAAEQKIYALERAGRGRVFARNVARAARDAYLIESGDGREPAPCDGQSARAGLGQHRKRRVGPLGA